MMQSALLLPEEDVMSSLLLTSGRTFVRTEGSTNMETRLRAKRASPDGEHNPAGCCWLSIESSR